METKEFEFKGFKMSGFIGLLLVFAMIGVMVWSGVTLTAPAIIIPILFVVLIISTRTAGTQRGPRNGVLR